MFTIRLLKEKEIPLVISLSLDIFTPIENQTPLYHDVGSWREKFRHNGLILGAFEEEKIVGYAFFYEKDISGGSIHCWRAGVYETYRKKGILRQLFTTAEEIFKKKGYRELTVNTYPEKFPLMHNYLLNYNYKKYKEKQKEFNGKIFKKLYFWKRIVSYRITNRKKFAKLI